MSRSLSRCGVNYATGGYNDYNYRSLIACCDRISLQSAMPMPESGKKQVKGPIAALAPTKKAPALGLGLWSKAIN